MLYWVHVHLYHVPVTIQFLQQGRLGSYGNSFSNNRFKVYTTVHQWLLAGNVPYLVQ